jgi:hypothetical protein
MLYVTPLTLGSDPRALPEHRVSATRIGRIGQAAATSGMYCSKLATHFAHSSRISTPLPALPRQQSFRNEALAALAAASRERYALHRLK